MLFFFLIQCTFAIGKSLSTRTWGNFFVVRVYERLNESINVTRKRGCTELCSRIILTRNLVM